MGVLEKELERVKFLTNIEKLDRSQSQELLITMYDTMQTMKRYYESIIAQNMGIPTEVIDCKFGEKS